MGRRRGRHRRPSARPAVIVTTGAGALLLGAAVPAGSVVGSAPVPFVTQPAGAGDGLAVVDGLLEQLSRADAGTAADAVNAALGELQDRATASSLVGEASGRIKRLVERNEASLEELVAETARQTEDDLQATLAGFKEQLRQLRDGMARAGADESLDDRALYERIVGILRRAAAQG